MPSYDFLNKNTGEVETHMMSYTKLDEFKQNNPHLERHFSPSSLPGFGDGMRMDTPNLKKNDSSFEKYVIQRMADTIPGNTIKTRHKNRGSREW